MCAIMLDTKGPEIRSGMLKDGQDINLEAGQDFELVNDFEYVGDNKRIGHSYPNLSQFVEVGGTILIDDGLIELSIVSKTDSVVKCKVIIKLFPSLPPSLPSFPLHSSSLPLPPSFSAHPLFISPSPTSPFPHTTSHSSKYGPWEKSKSSRSRVSPCGFDASPYPCAETPFLRACPLSSLADPALVWAQREMRLERRLACRIIRLTAASGRFQNAVVLNQSQTSCF
jgi:hypothetical protein